MTDRSLWQPVRQIACFGVPMFVLFISVPDPWRIASFAAAQETGTATEPPSSRDASSTSNVAEMETGGATSNTNRSTMKAVPSVDLDTASPEQLEGHLEQLVAALDASATTEEDIRAFRRLAAPVIDRLLEGTTDLTQPHHAAATEAYTVLYRETLLAMDTATFDAELARQQRDALAPPPYSFAKCLDWITIGKTIEQRALSVERNREAFTLLSEALASAPYPVAQENAKRMAAKAARWSLEGLPLGLTGTTLTGDPWDLASSRGKYVLIDVWATWCGPCLTSMPKLRSLHKAFGEQSLQIVGISKDQDPAALQAYLSEHPLPWPILFNAEQPGEHPFLDQYGIDSVPTMILVGPDGHVLDANPTIDSVRRRLKESP
jgi:thiol-disulfide isomerase/thioredoxin